MKKNLFFIVTIFSFIIICTSATYAKVEVKRMGNSEVKIKISDPAGIWDYFVTETNVGGAIIKREVLNGCPVSYEITLSAKHQLCTHFVQYSDCSTPMNIYRFNLNTATNQWVEGTPYVSPIEEKNSEDYKSAMKMHDNLLKFIAFISVLTLIVTLVILTKKSS